MLEADFALCGADQLVTLAPESGPSASSPLGVIQGGALAARNGRIIWVGPSAGFSTCVTILPGSTVLNANGQCVMPGFVDPHTHPVFAGDRADDFYARALGESYQRQLQSGGIMQSVEATRAADENYLLKAACERADTFLRYGTTTIQGKSGYGLSLEAELKSLRVLNRLKDTHALKTVPCFLGAHVVPSDFGGDTDDYVATLVETWLPAVRGLADFVDAWCEGGVFTPHQCEIMLRRGKALGFDICAHVNELGFAGGARMASALGARSVDHAVYLEDAEIASLSAAGTVAVLLPGTTFFLGSDTYAPARQLLEAGVTVALGTDYNPGTSFTQNMQFILTLAVLKLGMSVEEAIKGATINAAAAVNLRDQVGSLEVGKYCDLAVYCVHDYRHIPYNYAMNLVESVVASGNLVVRNGRRVSTPSRVHLT